MSVSRNSTPRFDPYGDSTPAADAANWPAPSPQGPLDARLRLPGSKSITNRELVLSALADGPSLLRAPLHSRDSDLMVEALRSFGTVVDRVAGDGRFGPDLAITPAEELAGSTTIDCGLAGTVMRFTPPVAALALGPTTFDGDEGARRRPMSTTISSLRALGVDVADDGLGALPFTVHGSGRVAGGDLEIDASASSQFVSGLLLAGARFDDGLRLTHSGARLPSQPHIDMTVAALRARGVDVSTPEPGRWVVSPGPIAGRTVDIEPDLSNAAPFLAAALVAGGTVRIDGWPESTTQVGDDLADLLPLFGATVERVDGALVVRGSGTITAVTVDLSTGGELAPALVALATLADGPSEITGIGHIRHHETDRLAALVAEITALGGGAEELPDGIRITPRPMHGGVWHSYDDHRMATAGAIIGLAIPDVDIEDIGTTAKTLPEFPELWHDLVRSTR
ncbi:3-phosphoshikimate 1-carboxyvinyltransferase 1 [Cnuibacter physcomitrellae]|uniref:3-phosphoshikimate 1-carboxyvinyltransferase n=1 Tax=Cnuibacter physcomitrellae TaxID=1619308 RepID=A0A1X9LK87_9MICO|nr:3-phosphoshikimate 1-carboxyvinyltransferase [Cnuibacter physcomitrellae]ARJ05626.1 3-phosphoshikimate 1-carboxyvinyltransferase [Cnuibacter physcomitrellae]GGI36120.1 3-phosphoshikimate 1-carboxyvinyltransferase 1 [Cnuibacter physcomitrellae]